MKIIDYILLIHAGIFLIHSVTFLLYQFEILDIDEDLVINCVRILNIIETVILIVTRFLDFGPWGSFGLGAFYILNIILLVLQLVFADFDIGRKLLDCIWVIFYIFMFMLDICHISIVDIDSFLNKSFFGSVIRDIIVALIIPFIKGLITDMFMRNE